MCMFCFLFLLMRRNTTKNKTYSHKIAKAVLKRCVSYLSHLVLQFRIGLESLGQIDMEPIEKNAEFS